jgi:DOMON domain
MASGYKNPAYVALGFSHDAQMGEDSVIECVPENGRVNIYSSWTSVTPYSALRDNVVS